MLKILITGGNGNISKMITNNLSHDFDITCICRSDFDLLDFKSVQNYLSLNSFDVLIHTAIAGGRRTKSENGDIVHNNLIMFENLAKFADKFRLIINFDSGAIYDRSTNIFCRKEEDLISVPSDYYGFSKYLIYNRSLNYANIVNFRIFNIFHINEETDRFIKACFVAKQKGTNVVISQDKYFDFMSETDFIKIVRHYLTNLNSLHNLPKTFNLSYKQKYTLSDIAHFILQDPTKVVIQSELNADQGNYCGNSNKLDKFGLDLDGLELGLQKFEKLFNIMTAQN
jgi:nucleoside-diphosphate-sugar epimerase